MITGSDTILSDAYDFLLLIHSNFGPILYSFHERWQYWA